LVLQNNKAGIGSLKLSSFWFSLQKNSEIEMGRRPWFVSSHMIWILIHSHNIFSCKHIIYDLVIVSSLGAL